jgi:hypothetical protein
MNININFLHGIQNFIEFINDNWTMLVFVACLAATVVRMVVNFINRPDDEKIEIVKAQIKQVMLKFVTEAEWDFIEWEKAGEIKRAQVIDRIFDTYPILSTIVNQEDIINWLDKIIDESLDVLRKIIKENLEIETTEENVETEVTIADETKVETETKEELL